MGLLPDPTEFILFLLTRRSYPSPLPKSNSSFMTQLDLHLQEAFPDPQANSASSEWPTYKELSAQGFLL